MKRTRSMRHALVLVALLAAATTPPAVGAQGATDPKWDPKTLTTPPLRHVQAPKPVRLALPNGMVVFLLEDHQLPVVSGRAYVRSSPSWIPNDKFGLGSVTGEVMRSGGTATRSGDWLDDRLGAIGASIETEVGAELATGRFRCLSDNRDEVIGLFADVLRRPAFPDEKIELARVGLRRAIAGRNDEMIPLLFRMGRVTAYGKDSPWSRDPEYATVEAIRREDCVALHRRVFEPRRMVLAIYGDFRAAEMKQTLTARFGDWKGAGEALPPGPPTPSVTTPRLVYAPKEGVTQSGIVLVQPGFRADDPDYPAMDVFSTALGGGFQSRLVNHIRTQRGLAYATGALAGDGWQHPGVFTAYSLTRGDSTMVALDLLREEVRRAVEAPFTADELKLAKESAQNSFVFNFEDASEVLFRAAFYEVIGYPQDFLDRYQRGLETVDAQAVQAAAKRKVHPDQLVAIVVGQEKDFDRPLDSAGLRVERVDISIPPPPSKTSAPAASAASLAKGQEWLKQAAELAGGSQAFASVRSLAVEQDVEVSVQGQTVQFTNSVAWILPDRLRVERRTPMGNMTDGFDGRRGWSQMGDQLEDKPDQAKLVQQQYERSLYRLFGHPEQITIQALDEPRTLDGKSYRMAVVKSDLLQDWSLLFDEDGRLAGMQFQSTGQGGPAQMTEMLSEWKAEGKLTVPHSSRTLRDGKPFTVAKVASYHLDPALSDSLFRKPAK